MSGLVRQTPDSGITKKMPRDGGDVAVWTVDLSIYSMTTPQARQLAAELLNLADLADKLNQDIIDNRKPS